MGPPPSSLRNNAETKENNGQTGCLCLGKPVLAQGGGRGLATEAAKAQVQVGLWGAHHGDSSHVTALRNGAPW